MSKIKEKDIEEIKLLFSRSTFICHSDCVTIQFLRIFLKNPPLWV